MTAPRFETSERACERLNISPQTLYAYVSRGLISTNPHPRDSRKRLYSSADIDLLHTQQEKGRSRHAIAASTLDFGEPILHSKLSSIRGGRYYYRGVSAITLSESSTLEDIFEMLCNTKITSQPRVVSSELIMPESTVFARIVGALAHQMKTSGTHGNKQNAYYLLRLLSSNAAKTAELSAQEPVHEMLGRSWSTHPQAPDLIRRALVLCADHELNASTYATRVTASTGASLAACLMTGVSTLSGSLHGGLTDRCLRWMKAQCKQPPPELTPSCKFDPPGFGHRLYPEGDPRPLEILKHCKEPESWKTTRSQILDLYNTHPALDYGLALLEHELNLPKGAGFAIFAIGRSVGWLAHSFEQRKTGALIRPRAYQNKPS